MIRLGTILWVGLVALLGFATFMVTYSVQGLEEDLGRVQRQTAVEQQEMRVLDAEWTYLTQPGRLEELNQRFLSLAPLSPAQLSQALGDLPRRPSETPAEMAAAALSANGGEPHVSAGGDAARPTVPQRASAPPENALPMVKPTLVMSTARPMAAPAPRSLDDLFAQVAGAR